MCLEENQKELELWCSAVWGVLWAGEDVNKGGEGESFRQPPIPLRKAGSPRAENMAALSFRID